MLGKYFQPCLVFVGRTQSLSIRTFLAKLILGQKGLPMTNALAYFI
jgi:hypothetical protein